MRTWLARRHGHTPCLARAWHGLGAGLARAWRGRGAGVARAGHGLGGGRARLLLGSCASLGAHGGARRPKATASGGAASQAASQARPGQTGKAGAGGLIWHRAN